MDVEMKVLLNVMISDRRGTDPAAEFLGRLAEKHDLSDTTVLVDRRGYLTALAWWDLRDHLDYVERNLIEKWFQTVVMRIDHFHSFWRGSPPSGRRWLRRFAYHYNFNRPNQALDNRTPVEKVFI